MRALCVDSHLEIEATELESETAVLERAAWKLVNRSFEGVEKAVEVNLF